MHICPQEIIVFLATLPFIGTALHWVVHRIRGDKCPPKECVLAACPHEDKNEIFDPMDP